MTNEEFEKERKRIETENLNIERQRQLRKLKRAGRFEFKKPSWSKTMMVAIFAICVEILIYSEVVMWCRYDLSALYALIAVPAALFGTFWSYTEKSKVENSANGIVYESTMLKLKNESNETTTINIDDTKNEGADGGEDACG